MKCPICNKAGLPDFTVEPIICPQCGSDLKGFVLIEKTNSFYKESKKKQKRRYIYSLLLIIIVSFVFLFIPRTKNDIHPITIQNNDSIINSLKTELANKENKIKELQSSIEKDKNIRFLYTVKKGDNLSKIAHVFYNDWNKYKEIEKDNNLQPGAIIFPNDTLVINLKVK